LIANDVAPLPDEYLKLMR